MASYLQDFKMDLYVTFRNELERQLSLRSRIEPLMSVKEVAHALNVSVRTVEDLLTFSDLKAIWVGGQRRLTRLGVSSNRPSVRERDTIGDVQQDSAIICKNLQSPARICTVVGHWPTRGMAIKSYKCAAHGVYAHM